MLMPALARDFSVVAVDQRGIGLSDKPQDGYDTGTLAQQPGQADGRAGPPSGSPCTEPTPACRSPTPWPRITRTGSNAWSSPRPPCRVYLPHHRCSCPRRSTPGSGTWPSTSSPEINEQLVTGREDIFFGAEFDASAGTSKLPADVVKYYVDTLAASPDALRGSFGIYRAFPAIIAQNEQRKSRRLTLPVLAIGGEQSAGEGPGNTMKLVADDVQTMVLAGSGHWVAEQAPEQLLAALTEFLAPYRASARTAKV